MFVVSKYVKTFDFSENCHMIQIQTIKNCKLKIFTKAIAYAKLAMNFIKDGSSKKNQQTAKQFTELIEPFPIIKAIMTDTRE